MVELEKRLKEEFPICYVEVEDNFINHQYIFTVKIKGYKNNQLKDLRRCYDHHGLEIRVLDLIIIELKELWYKLEYND